MSRVPGCWDIQGNTVIYIEILWLFIFDFKSIKTIENFYFLRYVFSQANGASLVPALGNQASSNTSRCIRGHTRICITKPLGAS